MDDLKTPECDKLSAVVTDRNIIAQFLDWLEDKHNVHLPKAPHNLLAEYFEIDLKMLDQERQAMLDNMRKKGDENAR